MKCVLCANLILVSLFVISVSQNEKDYELHIERVESIPGDKETVLDFSNLKVIKKNKQYLLNGSISFSEDMDNNYIVYIEASYSPLGNNQYIKSPLKVSPTRWCDYLNTTYKGYAQVSFQGHSNLPFIPEEGLCPIPKGTYYMKELEPKLENFPNHLSSGLWKVEQHQKLEDDYVGGIRYFYRITRKYK